MRFPQLSPNSYGAATPALQRILDEAGTLEWFPVVPLDTPRPQQHLFNHLSRLRDLFPDSAVLREPQVRWIEGGIVDFDHACPDIADTEGWGDPFGPTIWGRLLLELQLDVAATAEANPDIMQWVGPPLWPARGLFNVVGTGLHESPPHEEFRAEKRWAMLSHVNYNFHHVLDWALVLPETVERSPFYYLWQLHLAGCYVLGFIDGQFTAFRRVRN